MRSRRLLLFCLVGLVSGFVQGLPECAYAGEISASLAEVLAVASADEEIPIIVRIIEREEVGRFRNSSRGLRRRRIIRALRARAVESQGPLRAFVRRFGTRPMRELWLINGLSIRATPELIERIAAHPTVEKVVLDEVVALVGGGGGASTGPAEWNLDAIRVQEVWALGFTGAGIVVASVDTGADLAHPDLGPRWRGGTNSWLDLLEGSALPVDSEGHGSQVAGLMVGGDLGGTAIGVAPDSEWIAARVFDDDREAMLSDLHVALSWVLDPDGDPLTDDTPDIVNNSWGLASLPGTCTTEFTTDLDVLRAADVSVVFSAGNAGPSASSDLSPANDIEVLAVGATDVNESLLFASSRGPSSCDSTLFPNLVAPGVNVKSSDRWLLPPSYAYVSGTSFAAPHVSATLALLREAYPAASPADLVAAVEASAWDLLAPGPDNDSGYGLLDARSALGWMVDQFGCPTAATALDSDGDGFPDACDTCISSANGSQLDSNGDGYGNSCDADLTNDEIINFGDVAAFVIAFMTPDADADFNGDGIVNFGDLGVLATTFGGAPGPSGLVY